MTSVFSRGTTQLTLNLTMAKFMLSLLTFGAVIESARVARVCDDEELSKFKIDIFQKLTSLAATVLEFTNSNESEKEKVQNVLEELALRHKLEAFKSLRLSEHADDRSNTEMNDAMENVEEEIGNIPPHDNDVTTHSSIVTSQSHDVASQSNDAIGVSDGATKSTDATLTEQTTSKQCREFGDECSPKHLEFCCNDFVCVRKNKLSPRGRCRYKF